MTHISSLRGWKGSIKYMGDTEGWRARLVVKLPNGESFKRISTRHYSPMTAGVFLKNYQDELKARIGEDRNGVKEG